jgi:hypothetical protein
MLQGVSSRKSLAVVNVAGWRRHEPQIIYMMGLIFRPSLRQSVRHDYIVLALYIALE